MHTRDIKTLDPAVIAAAAKLLGDVATKTRASLEPGTYPIDEVITIHVGGQVTVSEDSDKTPTCSLPLLASLALLLKRMGVQREGALVLLREVMIEALEMGKDARVLLEKESGVKEGVEAIRTIVLGSLPRSPVKGAVKVAAQVSIPTA